MKKVCLVMAWLAWLPLLTLASPQEDDFVPSTLEELQTAVADVRAEYDVPAVGIALVGPDGPVWVDAIGKADLEIDVDADAETMFRIGSTSKMFVALAVLQLVEQGADLGIALDDDGARRLHAAPRRSRGHRRNNALRAANVAPQPRSHPDHRTARSAGGSHLRHRTARGPVSTAQAYSAGPAGTRYGVRRHSAGRARCSRH